MFKKILIVLVSIIAIVLIAAKIMPNEIGYKDSIEISASPAQVWEHTNSLKSLDMWSPWVAKDPKSKITFEGEDGAIGSKSCWDSKVEEVGKGCQWITDIEVNKHLETEMMIEKPEPGPSTVYIDLEKSALGTKVTWGLHGEVPWPFNLMIPYINKDMASKISADWTTGLKSLKTLAETSARASAQQTALEAQAAASEEFADDY